MFLVNIVRVKFSQMQLICKNFSPWKRPLYSMALAIDFMDGHGLSNKESWAPAKEDKR